MSQRAPLAGEQPSDKNDPTERSGPSLRVRRRWTVGIVLAVVCGAAMAGAVAMWKRPGDGKVEVAARDDEQPRLTRRVDESQLRQRCSHCHGFPEPDVLPKSLWKKTVWMMSAIGGFGPSIPGRVDPQAVAQWYEERAPEAFELPPLAISPEPGNLRLRKREIFWHDAPAPPFVAHMLLADITGDDRPELMVSDMRNGAVLMGRTGEPDWSLLPIGSLPNPAQMRAVDLDADGRMDLVVANLGSFLALDHRLGSVEWLRQVEGGSFERITLADGLGRVSDVQPVDLNGDGRLDIVVAEFGWRSTGRLLLLENRTAPGEPLSFAPRTIDGHHGASHVAVTDMNGDGQLDIVALFSQELEYVRCYLNQSGRLMEFHDLYRAPHPAWGSSSFVLVDLNQDGLIDVLLTNGDTYDNSLLKPYHGIRWLENKGSLNFEEHELTRMYGVFRAEAADMTGNGRLDIVACAMAEEDNVQGQVDLDQFVSILWLEQVAPGRFEPRLLEKAACHHPTLMLGDYDLDGNIDLFVGNGRFDDAEISGPTSAVDLWENLGD
jgi:hypothetical protein